ncbi:MAG TPA: hypothetical protein VMW48_12680, partial [Vicinamibacterales bacterium]|nr:hypothetical protein [Vicinamibacterales bacterium]
PEALANYLALIGWSPGDGDEVLPLETLASRFDLGTVGHSAGVFDEAKLAWVNRHYLKHASPARLAGLAHPYLARAGWVHDPPSPALEAWLRMVVPPAAWSVDKLSDLPQRLEQIFTYDATVALARADVRAEVSEPAALAVVRAWSAALGTAPRLAERQTFRELAKHVGAETGAKGKVLFHTIRVVCTGEPDGLELDVLLPAIEQAASFSAADGIVPVLGLRERATAFMAALDRVAP